MANFLPLASICRKGLLVVPFFLTCHKRWLYTLTASTLQASMIIIYPPLPMLKSIGSRVVCWRVCTLLLYLINGWLHIILKLALLSVSSGLGRLTFQRKLSFSCDSSFIGILLILRLVLLCSHGIEDSLHCLRISLKLGRFGCSWACETWFPLP